MAVDRPRLLVVHHAPMSSVQRLLAAALEGANHPDLEGAVEVVDRPALEARAPDVLAAQAAMLLVTPVNFGYMSGALKHFFDCSFRELEDTTQGLPYAAIIKGTTDATGAVRAVEAITTGMRWKRAHPPLVIQGEVTDAHLAEAADIAATLAAGLL